MIEKLNLQKKNSKMQYKLIESSLMCTFHTAGICVFRYFYCVFEILTGRVMNENTGKS